MLLRPDGSEVAEFLAGTADPLEVIAAAWEDFDLTSLSACRVCGWVMTDEEAVLEELMWKLGEASGRVRASRRLLLEHAMMDEPRYLRLAARLSEALEATEAASREGEARRLRDAPAASNFFLRGFSEIRMLETSGGSPAHEACDAWPSQR